jgi:hypothetical protein
MPESRAAGIIRRSTSANCPTPLLDQIEMDIEPAPKPIGHHVEVEFALRDDDCLVQFGICPEDWLRTTSIFFDQDELIFPTNGLE